MKTAMFILAAFSCIMLIASGCSPSTWVRVFNGTDHPIVLLVGAHGKTAVVLPGASDRALCSSVYYDPVHAVGFAIEDSRVRRFYALRTYDRLTNSQKSGSAASSRSNDGNT